MSTSMQAVPSELGEERMSLDILNTARAHTVFRTSQQALDEAATSRRPARALEDEMRLGISQHRCKNGRRQPTA
jgi:hypothetical protein